MAGFSKNEDADTIPQIRFLRTVSDVPARSSRLPQRMRVTKRSSIQGLCALVN
jgi:hypothetical protein